MTHTEHTYTNTYARTRARTALFRYQFLLLALEYTSNLREQWPEFRTVVTHVLQREALQLNSTTTQTVPLT